jgi:hypothetical protein
MNARVFFAPADDASRGEEHVRVNGTFTRSVVGRKEQPPQSGGLMTYNKEAR